MHIRLTPSRRSHGRRGSMSTEATAGFSAALLLVLAISVMEVVGVLGESVIGWLAAAPFLAAAFAPWPQVVLVGVLSTAITGALSMMEPGGFDATAGLRAVGMAVATIAAIAVSTIRQAHNRRFADMARLAAVSQEAVLRPIGPSVGRLAIAGRYVSASAAADIGGDLYEALETPYGVRMIVGDVRGKGVDAIRLANIVLGAFRHVAYERQDLRDVVSDLDRSVSRSIDDEDFVTAVIVEERGGTLTVVNCGHPAPILLRRGAATALVPDRAAPPLGLHPDAQPRVAYLEPGDRLLLYTDGLAEARRSGEFFPTLERAAGLLGHGTVEDGLTSLGSALSDWVRGSFDDDIALLLLEYSGTIGDDDPSLPSWEIT